MTDQQFPEPTVDIFIINPRGELLLLQSHKWPGVYVVPGGHIELGERMEEAVVREAREETGLWLCIFQVCAMQVRTVSWADPRDLLARLQAPKIEEEIKALDDAMVEELWREKVPQFMKHRPGDGGQNWLKHRKKNGATGSAGTCPTSKVTTPRCAARG